MLVFLGLISPGQAPLQSFGWAASMDMPSASPPAEDTFSTSWEESATTTNPDNTVLVEVSGLAGDSLVPGAQDVVTVRQGFDL